MSQRERRRVSVSRRTVTIAVPTVVALGAGGAFAMAAIPASDGMINACYATNGLRGALRLVDSPSDCTRFETAIKWNQKGDPGAQGIQGPQGDKGAQGDTGPAGAKGDTGPAGADGTAAILIGGEALNTGTAVGFLDLNGIKGESTDAGHRDGIDIKSFSFGVKISGSAGSAGGGAGAGKATFSTFHFNKIYDASTPELLADAASGTHIASAMFSFRKPGGGQQDFLTIKLTDVVVREYQQGGTQEPPLLESVSLDAAKFEVSYGAHKADGSLGSPARMGWDLTANKAF